MSIELTKKFAPGLLHLAEQLVPHDSVICSFSAGPQGGYTSAWGNVPFIVIQPETLYGYDPDLVVIRGEHDCTLVTSDGEEFELTFQGLLDYLKQLPRPLHTFAE